MFDFGVQSLLKINSQFQLGRHIALPSSLDSVTIINHHDEIDPQQVYVSERQKQQIWQSVLNLYETGTHPAISLCIRKQGEIILNRSIGHAHGNIPKWSHIFAHHIEDNTVMTPDTPVCFFSGSKAVTAFLIHLLNEDKLINLHDPISYYAPEFGINGKQDISIYQILTHRCDLSSPKHIKLDNINDKLNIWQHICHLTPSRNKIGSLAYQAITGGFILEKIINIVTGDSIDKMLDERIRQPMKMKYFHYGAKSNDKSQVATNYLSGIEPTFPISNMINNMLGDSIDNITNLSNSDDFYNTTIPAGNLIGTTEEMSRFYQMLLNGGRWKDQQICQPVTIQRLIQPHGTMQFDLNLLFPMHYTAGLMLGSDPIGIWGQHTSQAFGHIGLINKFFWADKKRDISVALNTTGMPVIANHMPALINFIAKVNQCCK